MTDGYTPPPLPTDVSARPRQASTKRVLLLIAAVGCGLPVLAVGTCTGLAFLSAAREAAKPTTLDAAWLGMNGIREGTLKVRNVSGENLNHVVLSARWFSKSGTPVAEGTSEPFSIQRNEERVLSIDVRPDSNLRVRVDDPPTMYGEAWKSFTPEQQQAKWREHSRTSEASEFAFRQTYENAITQRPKITATVGGADIKVEIQSTPSFSGATQ